MKFVSLLGSTGSIGTQTLEVVTRHPDKLKVVSLCAGKQISTLLEQIHRFQPALVSVSDEEACAGLKKEMPGFKGRITYGNQGLIEAATLPQATHVVVALVGSLGLVPTLEALKSNKVVALANKETLVAGGHLVNQVLATGRGKLIPVDSEHSAIFQCLKGEARSEVERIWLTASGGPFRGIDPEKLKKVTKSQVLAHPIWKMGNKITVDSASLMNKGLEVIEAKWLFNVSTDQIKVVVHPQGIIHSMVEFIDGSTIAQMGLPDMKTPIQVALSYPERWESPGPKLELSHLQNLTFEAPDLKTFPLLQMAYEAAREGGSLPAVLNAANEEAVRLFLEDHLPFWEIPAVVRRAMDAHSNQPFPNLDDVQASDRRARQFVCEAVARKVSVSG